MFGKHRSSFSDPAIPQDDSVSSPVFKVNDQGNAVAIFTSNFVGHSSYPGNEAFIQSSFYTRNVGWSPTQVISNTNLNSRVRYLYFGQADPDIALNSSNYAVAVWEVAAYNESPFPAIVVATIRDPNTGIWGPVTTISDQGGVLVVNNINVSLNKAGTALAAWQYREVRWN